MAGRLILDACNPALLANGLPDAGATLTFYINGTSTPQNVFTTSALSVALDNPLSPDASGRFPPIWAPDSNTYKVVWTPTGVAPITINDVVPFGPVPVEVGSGQVSIYDYLSDAQIADVESYGYTLDCSAEIQAAIDDIGSNGIGEVVFPIGGYAVETGLTTNSSRNMCIRGQGMGVGVPTAGTGKAIIKAIGSFSGDMFYRLPGSNEGANVLIEDIVFDCNHKATNGFHVTKTGGYRLSRVAVLNAVANAYKVEGGSLASNIEFNECWASSETTPNMTGACYHLDALYCHINNSIGQNAAYGVKLTSSTGGSNHHVENSCHFEGVTVAALFSDAGGNGSIISGNRLIASINGCNGVTLASGATALTIIGNAIPVSDKTAFGIVESTGSGGQHTIVGNIIGGPDSASGATGAGIRWQASGARNTSGNNDIAGFAYGILQDASAAGTVNTSTGDRVSGVNATGGILVSGGQLIAVGTNTALSITGATIANPQQRTLVDGASVPVDATGGADYTFLLIAAGSRTIEAPSNPTDGQKITFIIYNGSGGAMTTTFATGAGGYCLPAFVDPASTKAVSITFEYSSSWVGSTGRWVIVGAQSADITIA